MRVKDFHFDLPDELIARYPMSERTASRLLVVGAEPGELEHRHFVDVLDYLQPGDLMVFNNTRVIPARMFGQKASGGKIEMLVERVLDEQHVLAHVRASNSPKAGAKLIFDGGVKAEVMGRQGALFELRFDDERSVLQCLEAHGHMPLPPYIDRADQLEDRERYQTVYSSREGAVAAPTAGLHFDDALLAELDARGIDKAFVTLHVGAGTFQPVKVDDINDHQMHSEYMEVPAEVCDQVAAAKARGGRVVAVGTTSVRSLESAARFSGTHEGKPLQPYTGETDIFIYPGYEFQVVDKLITNFHLPESTLMMLVSALSGTEQIREAYRVAVAEQYRFFSYGDAMLLSKLAGVDTPPSQPPLSQESNLEQD